MKRRNNKGITLIALVITIIILLILAGIVLSLTIGKSGIINNAEVAGEETNKQTATEKINLKITNSQMDSYATLQRMPTLQELANDFCEDSEIQYVTLESKKVANLEKIDVGEATSIFTKLKEYPYEFEINSSLQLASVDGIPVVAKSNPDIKVLFDGKMSKGTITFEEDTIDDYEYYEFIYGLNDIGSGKGRIFSKIVSKEFLKECKTSGDIFYVSDSGGARAFVTIQISNITANEITFTALTSGSSWESQTGYIYKIIGRNM